MDYTRNRHNSNNNNEEAEELEDEFRLHVTSGELSDEDYYL